VTTRAMTASRGPETSELDARASAPTLSSASTLDCDEIRGLLPHRWPFLLIDRVIEVTPGEEATAIKNVAANEPCFAGHFPERSIMPGVLLIEALAQLGGIVVAMARQKEREPVVKGSGRAYLASVHRVRFRHLVVPGDQVVMHVSRSHTSAGLVEFRGDARVNGTVAVSGSFVIAV